MRVSILGAGYVGLVTGACLASVGHQVSIVDVDEFKIERLHAGILPIYERNLDDLVKQGLESGDLSFSTSIVQSIKDTEIIVIAVGTPMQEDGSADLSQVKSAAESIGRAMSEDYGKKIVVLKSTAPVGTTKQLESWIREQQVHSVEFAVVSNPEFLREGTAVQDTFQMTRVVIGSSNEAATQMVSKMYEPFSSQVVITNVETAEMIKYASNAFLATKISFINEISRLCECVGADVTMVAKGMGLDPRIQPHFLHAGVGYGGPCLPKDLRVLLDMGKTFDMKMSILEAVEEGNRRQKVHFIKKLDAAFGGAWGHKTVAILGLTFKPFTDDLRGAPSLDILHLLKDRGAEVRLYDPLLSQNPSITSLDERVFANLDEALAGVDAALILTEWPEFSDINWAHVKDKMRTPIVIDGRNVCDVFVMQEIGITYHSMGRPTLVRQ